MNQALERILEQGIKPHADAIAPIVIDGEGVAVVVFEPALEAVTAAQHYGWDGKAKVFKLDARKAQGDSITARWFSSGRPGRIFVISGKGTLLVNYAQGAGFTLEPGSTTTIN
jgi:hypothetical protein